MNLTNAGKALNFMRSMLDTTKATVAPIEFKEKKPILNGSSQLYFERVSPESCGIESRYVHEFVRELADNKKVAMQSIMLIRGNKVFFDADIGSHDSSIPKATFSECKSIVSLAIGVLVTQGNLKINELITDIFSDKITPMAKIRLKGLTVKHLLTMTACVTFNESEAMITSDWTKSFLNSDTEGEFGKAFRYNSLNTYILSAIIKERTGMGLSEFLDSTLFCALGITEYYWEKCPMGIEKGGWGLYIRREDIAKLGLLIMQKGTWNGKRLISKKYIDDATSSQAEVPKEYGDYDYGFHIWTGRNSDSFLFNGMLGQNLLGYRKNGVMLIINCGNTDAFQKGDFFAVADKYFNRDFPDAMPENHEDFNALDEFRRSLKQKQAKKSFLDIYENKRNTEKDISDLDGKIFRVEGANAVSTGFAPLFLQFIQANYTGGLEEIRFQKSDCGLVLEFIESDESHKINVGFKEAIRNIVEFHGEPYIVSAKGEFSNSEDGVPVLNIDFDFLETPYKRSCKFFFENGEVFAIFGEAPGLDMARSSNDLMFFLGPNGQKIENVFSKLDGDYFSIKFEKAFAPRITLTEIKE